MTRISEEKNIEKIEHKSKKNMLLGTILGYIAIGVSFCYGLFLTPEIVEAVGENNYGLYGLTASIVALLLMDFGLSTTINTYLARLRANNDKEGVQRFLAAIFKLYLLLDIIFVAIIAILYFLAPFIFQKAYQPDQIQILQYLFIIVGFLTIIAVPCSSFTAVISTYEKFGMIKTFDIIQKVSYLGLSILSVAMGWGVIGIVAVNAISGVFAIILRFLYMRFYIGIKLDLRKGISRSELKSILSFSAWGLLGTIFSRLVITITPFILGIVSNDVQVSIFALVTTIEQYIFMLGEMTSSFFMAKLARNDKFDTEEERIKHLQDLSEKIAKLQFIVIALIIVGFASVGQEFINVWMKGKETYAILYWCILLITGYEVIHIPQLSLQNAMFVQGHIAPYAVGQMIKAGVNLSLSFILSYHYGAFGASIAICAACIAELIATNIIYKKYLKISIGHFFYAVFFRGFFTFVITLGVGLALHFFLPLDNVMLLKLGINGVSVVTVYLICTYFITFNHEERVYYRGVLRGVFHRKKKKPEEVVEVENKEQIAEEEVKQKEE